MDLLPGDHKPWGIELKAFCLLMHLSQLTNYIFPGLGIILPIVMWATNKAESEAVDIHGKHILNWILSAFIYGLICALLTFLSIGALGLLVLGICNLVFIIIAAVKANNGEFWRYPLTIQFLK